MIRISTCFLFLQFLLFDSLNTSAQWTGLTSGVTQTLNDVFFINGKTGFVAGDPVTFGSEGLLMKTTNGGQSWSTISTGLNARFTGVWFVNDHTGFAVNEGGKILKTTDQGVTWNTVFDTIYQNLGKIFFVDELRGYVVDRDYVNTGYYGLLKTIDGGATWKFAGAEFGQIFDLCFISPDTGFVASLEDYGHISATYDGGQTWHELFGTPGYYAAYTVGAENKDSILAAGDGSNLWASGNGGSTWHDLPVPNQSHMEMSLLSASEVWIAGVGIIHTVDAGLTWTFELDNVGFKAIHFPSKDTGYAVGYSGAIYTHVAGASFCIDNFEPNNTSATASFIPLNKKTLALIGEAGDKDWFHFTSLVNQNNVRILLKSLPKNYNLKFFDHNLNTLGSSMNHGKTNDTIIFNNLPAPQTYYIQVKGGNANVFDADDCYSLKVETSASPFRSTEFYSSEENPEIILFPNPASGKIYFDVPGEDVEGNVVTIFDFTGRKMLSEKLADVDNAMDISSLSAGMYLLEIKNDDRVKVRKFEVNHQ